MKFAVVRSHQAFILFYLFNYLFIFFFCKNYRRQNLLFAKRLKNGSLKYHKQILYKYQESSIQHVNTKNSTEIFYKEFKNPC